MLKIDHISKTFAKGTINEKKALDDISLTVDTGKIILDDEDITKKPDYLRSKDIGKLFQNPLRGTAPHMTIKENLALAYMRADHNTNMFSKITRKDENKFKDELKKLDMNLEDRLNTQVGLLSGGQRQALTLLMATIVPPKVLLLDEHTAALDPVMAEKVMTLTNNIVKENNITCLMVTHNMKMALATGNRTLIMNNGKIIHELSEDIKKTMNIDELLKVFRESLNDDRIILEN